MTSILKLVGLTAVLLLAGITTGSAQSAEGSTEQKAVLVTGASTGIGRKITETLAAHGYFVYAGARKQKDLDALNEIDNVQSIRLDVTVQDEIDAAVETVRRGGRGLYGLVNNAGVAIGGPMTEVSVDELQWLFDVNVFGVYRVSQAFAPLIIESKGRITTIGSISGILSGTFFGHYSMSKHAIEAYTDSLAGEMGYLGVQVSVIEPGNYSSQITNSAFARIKEKDYMQEGSPFAKQMQALLDRPSDRKQYKEPDEVADAALHALFDDNPYRRYMVVPNEKEAGLTIGKAVEELVQLNEYQAYSYSREELIAMLDKAMEPEAE